MSGGLAARGDVHAIWHARMHDSVALTVVHAAVAVAVAVLLHRADGMCWSLTRGAAAALRPVRAVLARVLSAWARTGGHGGTAEQVLSLAVRCWERPPPKKAMLADVVARRGPPVTGFVLTI